MSPRNLREAHAHLLAFGREMTLTNLGGCADRDACLQVVCERSRRMLEERQAGWFIGTGVRTSAWPDSRWPTRAELDLACPDRPCVLLGFDHHSAAANSPALAAAGLGPISADPAPGTVERDTGGEATGLVLEGAFERVRAAIPPPTPDESRAHARAACDALAALGFAEAHDLLAPPELGPILADLHDAGQLSIRVGLFTPLDQLDAQAAGAQRWGRPGVHLLGAKLFADGTLNSRTALMLEPYRDPIPGQPRGTQLLTPRQLTDAMDQCASRGLALAVHAIGDGAVRLVLDARQEQLKRSSANRSAPPLRIEHCELIDERDVPRFAELNAIASVQPCHLLYDIEVLRGQAPGRLHRVLPLRDLLDSGLRPGTSLIFGSDVPIVRAQPDDSIVAATQRRRPGSGDAIAPDQAISRAQAWACFARD